MNTIKDLLFALILLLAGVVCTLLMQFTSFEIAGIGGVIFPLIGLVIAEHRNSHRLSKQPQA